MPDLYADLGVAPDATADDIKRAYRRKARESHPDAGGDGDTFKRVTHAYHVLSDPVRRRRYDRLGDDGTSATRDADPFGFGAAGFGGVGDVIDAFFGTAFGGGSTRTASRMEPGRDVLVRTEVTLGEVASGVNRPVEVEVALTCDGCGGSGSANGAAPTTCRTCGGAGQVQRLVRTAFGQLATAAACSACHGTGTTVDDPCRGCGGEGRRLQRRKVTVQVPAGVDSGDRLRVAGAGEAGRHGAPSGDLYVEVGVAEHELFERRGRDLLGQVTVPFVQAALGATLTVPTVDGAEVEVDLPPGSQPGDVLTVPKAGLPGPGGSRGALHLSVQVRVPRDLDDEQRDLVTRLAEIRGEDVPPRGHNLFSRLREAFR